MAKESNKRLELLKKIPDYTKNVTKSVLFSAKDIIQDIAPEMTQFAESTSDISKSALEGTRNFSTSFTSYLKNFQNSQVMSDAKQIKSDLISDLKSGKFYNKDREEQRMEDSYNSEMKDMVSDLGFDLGDEDFDDETILKKLREANSKKENNDIESGETNITINKTNVSLGNSDKSAKNILAGIATSSRLTSKTMVDASNYIASNQNGMFSIYSINSERMFSEVSNALSDMSGYLKGLFDYTGTLNNYIKSTMEFYDKTTKSADMLVAMQKELRDISRITAGIEDDKNNTNTRTSHVDVFSNGLNYQSYWSKVKENIKDGIDGTGLSGMWSLASDLSKNSGGQSVLQELGANPLKFISDKLAKTIIINPIKENLEKTNETFSSFFQGLSLKGKRIGQEKGPIYKILSDILGVKADRKESLKTDIKEKNVQWNTFADTAVTTVIPTLLSKILSAITGDKEHAFNYQSGKFNTVEDIKKDYDSREKSVKTSQYTDYRNQASDIFDTFGLDENAKKYYLKEFDKFINYLNENEMFFNAKSDTFEKMKSLGMTGIDEDTFNMAKAVIASTKDNGIKLNNIVYDTRTAENNFLKRSNEEMYKTGLSSINNGYKKDNNNANITAGIFASSLNAKDIYGLSLMDYIRDIKGILLEGIFTYKGNRDQLGVNPEDRLQQHRQRLINVAQRDSRSTNSNSGRSTYGDDYIPTDERNKIGDRLKNIDRDTLRNKVTEYKRTKYDDESENSEENSNDNNNNDILNRSGRLFSTLNQVKSNITSIGRIPTDIINNGLVVLNDSMYRILYGPDSALFKFTTNIRGKIEGLLKGVNNFLVNKILDPLREKLFGEEGIITKLENKLKNIFSKYASVIKDKLLGTKNNFGGYEGGLLSNFANNMKNKFYSIRRYATGAGYTDPITGEKFETEEGSLIANVKTSFNNIKEKLETKLFGTKDDNGVRDNNGIIPKIKDQFTSVINKIKDKFFGKFGVDGSDIKQSMPSIMSGAGIGAAVSLYSSLFLPLGIGIVPGLLLGGATGFAKSSDQFQKFLFGDGTKNGLLGGKDLKAKIDKYLPSTGKGAAIGGLLGVLTGNPLIGPMLGASIGFARKSETVQTFLFGKDGDDSEALIKKETIAKMKEVFPKAAAIGTGAFVWNKLGFIGSSLLPGGIIGASIFGFASSMALQSERVKKFLFGEIDPDTGLRDKNGILGRIGLWFKYNFIEEVKMGVYNVTGSVKNWFMQKIGNKLQDAFKPWFEEIKLFGKKIVGFFGNAIKTTFEKSVGIPLKKIFDGILNPIKKLFGGFFNTIKKAIELPFAAIGKSGEALAKKHRRMGLEYTDEYFDKKRKRDKTAKENIKNFKKEKKDRRQKLSHLQDVMWKYNFDRKNSHVQDAMDDFDNKYKDGKWKDIPLRTYKSVNALETESVKHTSILDKLSQIGSNIKDTVSNMYENLKNKANNVADSAKSKYYNAKNVTKDKFKDIKDDLSDRKESLSEYFKNIKNKKDNSTSTIKNIINDELDKVVRMTTKDHNNAEKKSDKENIIRPTKNEVFRKAGESDKENIIRPTKNGVFRKAGESDNNYKPAEIKNENTPIENNKSKKSSKLNKDDVQSSNSYLKSIKLNTASIEREVAGQLDGVGWNLDAIRKILAKFTGIDEKGDPLRRGNRKRSIFNRIRNIVMKPVDFVMDTITGVKNKIVDGITSGFKAIGSTIKGGIGLIGNVFKAGGAVLKGAMSAIATTLKTLGSIIEVGAKVLGTAAIQATKVVGTLFTSAIKATGTLLNGAIIGVSKLGAGLLKGLGSLIGGIASATGKIVSGIGSLGGQILKAGGTAIKGIVKLTTDITKTLYKGVKGIFSGVTRLITSPFRAFSKKRKTKLSSHHISITNFNDLLKASSVNPMHVVVDNIVDTNNVNDTNRHNNDNGDNTQPVIGDENPKTPNDQNGTSDDLHNDRSDSKINKIQNTLSSFADRLSSINLLDKFKRKPKAPNMAAVGSKLQKMENQANEDVTSYITTISSNNGDHNFIQDAKNIDDIEAGKTLMVKAMGQTAQASKGMFAFMAKHAKKGGLLSKLGTLLFMALPKLISLFNYFKSGKFANSLIKLLAKTPIGKALSSLLGLLGKGKNPKNTSLPNLLGNKNRSDNKKPSLKDRIKNRFNKNKDTEIKDDAAKKPSLKDRIKNRFKKNKDTEIKGVDKKPKVVINRNITPISNQQSVSGRITDTTKLLPSPKEKTTTKTDSTALTLTTPKKGNNKLTITRPKITSKGKLSEVKSPITSKRNNKGGKLRKLSSIGNTIVNTVGDVVSNAENAYNTYNNPRPNNPIDLSNIQNAITIQGNAVIQVNGNLSGLTPYIGQGLPSPQSGGNGSIGGTNIDLGDISDKYEKLKEIKNTITKSPEDRKLIGDSKIEPIPKKSKLKNNILTGKDSLIKSQARNRAATSAGDLVSDGIGHVTDNVVNNVLGDNVGSLVNGKIHGAISDKTAAFTENVMSSRLATTTKNTIKSGTNKVLSAAKVTGSVVKDNGKSLISKLSELVNSICNSKPMVKVFGEHAHILPKIGKWIVEKLSKLGAKKLPTVIAKLSAKVASGIASFGIIPTAFVAWDGVTGAMATEVRQIFKLSPNSDVSKAMRISASLAKIISNNLTFGLISYETIAKFIYSLIATKEDKQNLENSKNEFKKQYNDYVTEQQARGEKVKSFDEWNDDQNGISFKRAVKGTKSAIKSTYSNVINGVKSAKDVIASLPGRAKSTISDTIDKVENSKVGKFVGEQFTNAKSTVNRVVDTVKESKPVKEDKQNLENSKKAIQNSKVGKFVGEQFTNAKSTVNRVVDTVKESKPVKAIQNSKVGKFVGEQFTNAKKYAGSVVDRTKESVNNSIDTVKNGISNTVKNIENSKFGKYVSNGISGIKNYTGGVIERTKESVGNAVNTVKDVGSKIGSGISSFASNIFGRVKSGISSLVNKGSDATKTLVSDVKNDLSNTTPIDVLQAYGKYKMLYDGNPTMDRGNTTAYPYDNPMGSIPDMPAPQNVGGYAIQLGIFNLGNGEAPVVDYRVMPSGNSTIKPTNPINLSDGIKMAGNIATGGVLGSIGKGISAVKNFITGKSNNTQPTTQSKQENPNIILPRDIIGHSISAKDFAREVKTDNKGNVDLSGQHLNINNLDSAIATNAGALLMKTGKNYARTIKNQLNTIDGVRQQTNLLIDRSNTASRLTMLKANDAMKNTANTYSNVVSNAMNTTADMATTNTTGDIMTNGVTDNNSSQIQNDNDGNTERSISSALKRTAKTIKNKITNLSIKSKEVGSKIIKTVKTNAGKVFNAVKNSSVGKAVTSTINKGKSLLSSAKTTVSNTAKKIMNFVGLGGNGDNKSVKPQGGNSSVDTINGMAYYSQYDPQWSSVPYNAKGETGRTIQTSGCGPTSAAMVVSSLTGKYVNPVEAVQFSLKGGYKQAGVGTGWNYFEPFGKQYGINFSQKGVDKNVLQSALQSRKPVILSGQGAIPFTRGGHFIVAAGISSDGNKVLINDPVSKDRSKAYSLTQILRDARQMWIADKSLSGSAPTITANSDGATAAQDGGQQQQQEDNNPLSIISKIGDTIVQASNAVTMGKVFTPHLDAQSGGDSAAPGSQTYNGQIGTGTVAKGVKNYSDIFNAAGRKYNVEPEIMEAIAMQESSGDPRCGYPNAPAWGIMQIENTLASEYKSFGEQYEGKSYTLQDRLDPSKAIPFATSRYSSDLKHYNGDYLKAIQAYNFSKYSLDMLIKRYPNDWMSKRNIMGSINGSGNPYGDPQYIEHVLRYYKGKVIKNTGGGNGDSDKVHKTKDGKNPMFNIIQFPNPEILKEAKRDKTRSKKKIKPMGGNGGSDVKAPKVTPLVTKNNKKKVKPMGGNGGSDVKAPKLIKTTKPQNVNRDTPKPKIQTSENINSFVKHNDKQMSSRINDLLASKETITNAVSGNNLDTVITILNTIANNTEQTASNTLEIANKEFTVTNQYNSNIEHTQNVNNAGDTNLTNVNPFINAAQSAANTSTSAYDYAKRLAAK